MGRVTGIGGVFFKADDPKQLQKWYEDNLGIESDDQGYVTFTWRDKDDPDLIGHTIWSPFPKDTKYFDPSKSPYMVNFRVDNLDELLDTLRERGVEVDDKVEEYEYGRFGWCMDPEGNRIELWEPPKDKKEVF